MLPRSSPERIDRGQARGGRALEISRLIGRSLRAAVDLEALGERTITIDCDVLQADGGTRTVSVTGGWVALALAVNRLLNEGRLESNPIKRQVAAISVGLVGGKYALDLCYRQDSQAEVDLNLVGAKPGGLIEVQGTAEKGSFSPAQLQAMVGIGRTGLKHLFRLQKKALPRWPLKA
jgi:ribonuclease PH